MKPFSYAAAGGRKVKPRIERGPINTTLLTASALSALALASQPYGGTDPLTWGLHGFAVLGGAALWLRGGRLLIKDYRLRRDFAISQSVSLDHGSAREASRDERLARGMHDARSGELYGLDGGGHAIFRPEHAPFAVIEMPPGVGKTVNLVTGSVLHRAMLGDSLIVPDVKNELSVMLAPALRKLGYEVWCINPANQFAHITGNVELNPYQALLDAVYGDPEQRRDAVKFASDLAALHYPTTSHEKNPYFSYGSRRAIVFGNLRNALVDPANCTPTGLYRLLTDPRKFLESCVAIQEFETTIAKDPVLEVAKLEALNLLHRADKNEENLAAFLEGATQRLISFNPAGHLGDYGKSATHNLNALRDRQIIVFIQIPLSHIRDFSDFISLLTHNLIAACKAKPSGRRVHIVGEEALNFRFRDLVSDLETMRGLSVTADFYIQSFAGLERHYGKEAAAAIESYADIRIYGGLNSYVRAKHVSDLLAEETIRKQEASYRSSFDEMNLNSREMGRRLMTPDEVMAMPKDQAWMFVRNMRPIKLQMLSYAQVSPWRDWVAPSPITDTRLHAPETLRIDYDKLKGGRS